MSSPVSSPSSSPSCSSSPSSPSSSSFSPSPSPSASLPSPASFLPRDLIRLVSHYSLSVVSIYSLSRLSRHYQAAICHPLAFAHCDSFSVERNHSNKPVDCLAYFHEKYPNRGLTRYPLSSLSSHSFLCKYAVLKLSLSDQDEWGWVRLLTHFPACCALSLDFIDLEQRPLPSPLIPLHVARCSFPHIKRLALSKPHPSLISSYLSLLPSLSSLAIKQYLNTFLLDSYDLTPSPSVWALTAPKAHILSLHVDAAYVNVPRSVRALFLAEIPFTSKFPPSLPSLLCLHIRRQDTIPVALAACSLAHSLICLNICVYSYRQYRVLRPLVSRLPRLLYMTLHFSSYFAEEAEEDIPLSVHSQQMQEMLSNKKELRGLTVVISAKSLLSCAVPSAAEEREEKRREDTRVSRAMLRVLASQRGFAAETCEPEREKETISFYQLFEGITLPSLLYFYYSCHTTLGSPASSSPPSLFLCDEQHFPSFRHCNEIHVRSLGLHQKEDEIVDSLFIKHAGQGEEGEKRDNTYWRNKIENAMEGVYQRYVRDDAFTQLEGK